MKWDDFQEELDYNPVERETIIQIARMVSDLIKRRKVLGWTQAEVATKAGLSQAQIARLENSSQIPRADTLIKVAVALGMKVDLNVNREEAAANLLEMIHESREAYSNGDTMSTAELIESMSVKDYVKRYLIK